MGPFTIGHMVIRHAGRKLQTRWDFQTKVRSRWTGTSCFFSGSCNLRPRMCDFVPCDWTVQGAYHCWRIYLPDAIPRGLRLVLKRRLPLLFFFSNLNKRSRRFLSFNRKIKQTLDGPYISLCWHWGSIHTTTGAFENAALFLRLGLPSTLIRHENALQTGVI